MTIRASLARGCGLASSWALRHIAHRNASTLPGRIALSVDPNLIADLASKCRQGSIVVCGTNGKTTTNNILARAIDQSSDGVLCNWAGANMATGVATALLPSGTYAWGVFENDELSTISIVPELKPRLFVLLNLFRDQLDRSGEIDRVQDVIVRALAASPATTLLYNGDDPLCEGIAIRARENGNATLAFGIGENLNLPRDRVTGGAFCQRCGAPLSYEYRQYGQLGLYKCNACGFARPSLVFSAHNVQVSREGVSFDAQVDKTLMDASAWRLSADKLEDEGQHHIAAKWGGTYMVYNLLAAWAAAHLVGVDDASFAQVLDTYNPQNGRLQHFVVDGRHITLNLAKNPTGFNQNISMLMADMNPKIVYVIINDDYNDGKDVSWLWDVDFERLSAPNTSTSSGLTCFVGGHRANDMQVRFKYAGIDAKIATSVSDMLNQSIDISKDRSIYVLTNYSALWPAKAELERMGGEVS